MRNLNEVLAAKGAEYAPFDPARAPRIFRALESYFGKNLGARCHIIHILGTNGKGSSGRFITMGLEQNKRRVLHFSSPHLLRFNERYYRDGRELDDSELEAAHRALWACEAVREASYFEYASFLALYLARECEFFICEAGLGGEYDSTSVFAPCLSLYTRIGLDHQDMLGESLESIARTKLRAMSKRAIIARQGSALVENIARDIAAQKGARLWLYEDSLTPPQGFLIGDSIQSTQGAQSVDSHILESQGAREAQSLESRANSAPQAKTEQKSNQAAHHTESRAHTQNTDAPANDSAAYLATLPPFLRDNIENARRVLECFGLAFDFSSLGWLNLRGRCERLASNLIIDVGHNLCGAHALRDFITESRPHTRMNLIYNSYADKDIEAILSELLPIIKEVLIISVENSRICPRQRLVAICERLNIAYKDFDIRAMSEAEEYVVFGSFSVVERFLHLYQTHKHPKEVHER